MNKQIAALSLALGVLAGLPAWADDDLGINVLLEGQVAPGLYGRVDVGNNSHPNLYNREPIIYTRNARYANYKPVYLHVPPGHAKDWGKHCKHYNACERPVYFIRSEEYEESYQRAHPHDDDYDYDDDHHDNKKSNSNGGGKDKGNGKGGEKGKGKGNK